MRITHYEQFLLLPQCFQKSSAAVGSEQIYMWEKVNPFTMLLLQKPLCDDFLENIFISLTNKDFLVAYT